jgi:hypothetical protein
MGSSEVESMAIRQALQAALAFGSLSLALVPGLAQAQVESYLLGPGTSVGPNTKVVPKNCVTSADGTVSCDTQLQNSPSDTPAKPQYRLFTN